MTGPDRYEPIALDNPRVRAERAPLREVVALIYVFDELRVNWEPTE
jgi:hypothetical protein